MEEAGIMAHEDAMPQNPLLHILDPDEPDHRPSESSATLRAASATWMRRGYRVRYRDAFLIQLVRRGRPGPRSAPYIALSLAALALAVASWIAALRRRPWQVVTLALGPDDRILTHTQTSPRPPAP